jgi:S-DNA-T family DNA segregation ATPase FtsK/SpoIIIE
LRGGGAEGGCGAVGAAGVAAGRRAGPLLREGAGAGIHLILASERGLISGRAGSLNDNRLMLRMADRTDFAAIGVSPRQVPEVIPPGRAWRSANQAEAQVALLAADPSGQAQAEALRAIGRQSKAKEASLGPGRRPFQVKVLPAAATFAEAFEQVPAEQRRPLWGLLGLGGDEVVPVRVDFAGRGHNFLVAGPPGSGRSNALATLGVSLLAGGTRLVVVAPRESPLRRLAAHSAVRLVAGPAPDPAEVAGSLASGSGPVLR